MRPVIALMHHEEDIQKAPVIQIATLHCILLSSLRGWKSGAPLRYHN